MPARTASFLILIMTLAGAAACDDAKRDEAGSVSTAGNLSVYDLKTGDCFNGGRRVAEPEGEEQTVAQVKAVPCDKSHENEVFGVFEHPTDKGFTFPGGYEVTKVAQTGCADRFETYVGKPFEKSDLLIAVIAPGQLSWEQEDDRTIVCIVHGEKARTSAAKNSRD